MRKEEGVQSFLCTRFRFAYFHGLQSYRNERFLVVWISRWAFGHFPDVLLPPDRYFAFHC